jgi:hypothetical protein
MRLSGILSIRRFNWIFDVNYFSGARSRFPKGGGPNLVRKYIVE